jgi:hypothetical protein
MNINHMACAVQRVAVNSASGGLIFMTRRFLAAITFAALASTLIGAPVAAQRNSKDGAGLTIPFSTAGSNNGGTADVTGTFTITRFANQAGQLVAIGTVAATAENAAAAGGGVRTVITELTVPVTSITGGEDTPDGVILQQVACGILHLELGPLDLDVLGLVVHLDQVVLDITAEPGSGNLLGNLLCAIAGLLDGGSPLAQILNQLVGLLNQLIAAL